jgi:hypothetical protein
MLPDPRGESTCQLPGREVCRLIGLFFNVPMRDLGLEGRDRARGDSRRVTGTSAPGLIKDAMVAVLGTGAGDEGRNGIFTREWLDGIFIDESICR